MEEQEIVIVKWGDEPQVAVLPISEYERLMAFRPKPQDWKALVRQSRERARADLGGRALTPPEDAIRQMREERDEQLPGLR